MRLSYRFSTVVEQLMGIRYLIFCILMIGAVSSAVLGLLLALNISHPIQQVTSAIVDLTYGVRTDQLAVQGFTETKKLQQAVNFLVARLRELEQNRRQLLANLIHEIGRPLGGLRMGIQVLRRGAKTDPQILDELLEGMEMETGILTRLLEDLSLLHDQIIGTLELNFQTVSLSDWLPGVLYSIQEAAHRNGLNCIVDIPKDLPNIRIDPQRIAQAIGNLTANAIKYTPREGTVSISAGESGKLVWIRVSDTGPGIPIEEQEKIFEPFFRGTQRKRIKHGMGLGLNIARDFVTAHQGRLEVDSAPGLGSHFTIWLPKLMELENPSSDVKVAASNE